MRISDSAPAVRGQGWTASGSARLPNASRVKVTFGLSGGLVDAFGRARYAGEPVSGLGSTCGCWLNFSLEPPAFAMPSMALQAIIVR